MVEGAPDGRRQATVSDLAARLALAQSTVTELIDRTEAAGLVMRVASADRRTRGLRPADARGRAAAGAGGRRPAGRTGGAARGPQCGRGTDPPVLDGCDLPGVTDPSPRHADRRQGVVRQEAVQAPSEGCAVGAARPDDPAGRRLRRRRCPDSPGQPPHARVLRCRHVCRRCPRRGVRRSGQPERTSRVPARLSGKSAGPARDSKRTAQTGLIAQHDCRGLHRCGRGIVPGKRRPGRVDRRRECRSRQSSRAFGQTDVAESHRGMAAPSERSNAIGFRCVAEFR